MVTYTSAQLFAKLPQFLVETTEGTTPTGGAWTSCGSATNLEVRKNNELVDIGQVGSEDILDLAQGRYTYNATFQLQLLSSAFAKRWINAANFGTPTGTISETFSMAYSQYLNGTTENYVYLKGCRPKRLTLESNISQPLKATVEVEAMSVAKPSSTSISGTYASNPSGAVWTWLDGGANPLTWNSIGLNTKSFSVTFERNTEPIHILGSKDPQGTQPHARRISGNFTVAYTASEATTLETDFDSNTTRTLTFVLKSATSTLTLTGAEISEYSRSHSADDNDVLIENVGFKATTASIT